jgi:hypothetical protein
VGRAAEVEALAADIRTVKDGGTAFRVVVGEYGSGKSFFLQVIRQAAQRADCVTLKADIAQDMRLYGTGGRVRRLYTNLVASAGTKSQPDGGALAEVLERFISAAGRESERRGFDEGHIIRERLADLAFYQGGYLFIDVVLAYAEGVRLGDESLREGALRWLRGEYRTVTEARQALGVGGVIGDADLYPMLRLLAVLVTKAGYGGLVVELDELSVLARLNRSSRDQNYEQILTMVNSLLGGQAQHLMVVMAGTPEFVADPVRGLHSYAALRQRLSANTFGRPGLRDTASSVIGLEALTAEHLWLLLENVHRVYCSNARDPLPDRDAVLGAFLDHAARQLGGLASLTPREATRSWLHFLDILDQNRGEDWHSVLGVVPVNADLEPAEPDDGFAPLVATGGIAGDGVADHRL